jgi:hypothetical protein
VHKSKLFWFQAHRLQIYIFFHHRVRITEVFEQFIIEHFGVTKENFYDAVPYCLSYNYKKYRLSQVLFKSNRLMMREFKKENVRSIKLIVLDSF